MALGELSICAGVAVLNSGAFISSCCLGEESAGTDLMTGTFEGAAIGLAGSVFGTGRGAVFGSGSAARLGAWFSEVGASSSWTEK